MHSFFLTGMARSGTTLVEKLLCNHQELSILSQPFPYLFIELKKLFLRAKGINEYYVLNETINSGYELKEFNSFLKSFQITKENAETIFNAMTNYSGQLSKSNPALNFKSKNFIELFNTLVKDLSCNNNAFLFGSKEILCEEFLPCMTKNNIKVIIIVRDPRDVLSSANYPLKEKYLGVKKPTLFLLKTWRKSVDFIKYLNKSKNFHFLKYEDLVQNPYNELKKITDLLNVDSFENNYFDKGIFDQNKQLWKGNSSSDTNRSFISLDSVGAFKNTLSKEEIAYTEAICKREMLWLGYDFQVEELNATDAITSFKDYGVEDQPHLPANFSSQKNNIAFELNRLNH